MTGTSGTIRLLNSLMDSGNSDIDDLSDEEEQGAVGPHTFEDNPALGEQSDSSDSFSDDETDDSNTHQNKVNVG